MNDPADLHGIFAEFPAPNPDRPDRFTLLPPAPVPSPRAPTAGGSRPTLTWEAAAAGLKPRRIATGTRRVGR